MKRKSPNEKEKKEKYEKPKIIFCKKLTAVAGVCTGPDYLSFSGCKSTLCTMCVRS